MNENLAGKRMLLLAGTNLTIEAIRLAQRLGVWVAVADYNEETPAKKIADAAFNVSTTDIESLVQLCVDQKIDGVFTNWIDSMLPWGCKLCEKMGFPYPFTLEQIDAFTDKEKFKKLCIDFDVPVPRLYLDESSVILSQDIEFPVIVKPVDSSGSRGISVCHNISQLRNGMEKAKAYSRSRHVIVEQYIDEDEITVNYVIENGEITLTSIHDRYFNTEQEGVIKTPDIYIYPSKYTQMYEKNVDPLVKRMLKKAGLKNGSIFMQACVQNNQVYFYETGMRLNGCKIYHIVDAEYHYNALERLICFALTGTMGKPSAQELIQRKFQNWYSTISLLARPGTIKNICGMEALERDSSVVGINQWHFPGETITPEMIGTLPQTVIRITVKGHTKEELLDAIDHVYRQVRVYDTEGESMLLHPHKRSDLENHLNYTISGGDEMR